MNIFFLCCYFINSVCTQNSKRDHDLKPVKLLISSFAFISEKETLTVLFLAAWENVKQKMIKQPNDRALWTPELYSSPGKDCESDAEYMGLEKRHQTGRYSFASAGGRKWEGAAGGKTGTGKEFMSWNCPPVRKLRQLWRLSGTFCNTSSSTSHLTILISRCTRHVQQCDTTTPGDGGWEEYWPVIMNESIQRLVKDTYLCKFLYVFVLPQEERKQMEACVF